MINNGFIILIMKSFSEIETISKRASKAEGFSWGIAEEVGKAIRILELFGLAGIRNLNEYFISKKNHQYENLNLINEKNQSQKYLYCPIIFGVSFFDQVKNLEKFQKIHLNKIAYPLLALPFLSRGSEEIGKKIIYKFDEYSFLLNLNVNIFSQNFSNECPESANNIEISFLDNKDNFREDDWKNLYKLSEKTFVKETDSLKIGAAGAGLTDND